MLALGLFITDRFRQHVDAVEMLDELQFAVASLGVNVNELLALDSGRAPVELIHSDLETIDRTLASIDHHATGKARQHAVQIRSIVGQLEQDFEFGAVGDHQLYRPAVMPLALREILSDLRAAESSLTMVESQILQDKHRILDRRIMFTVAVFGMMALLFGSLCIFAFVLIHRRISGPVQALTAAVEDIGIDNLDHDVPVMSGDDELARLTEAFNTMLARQREHKRELETYQNDLSRALVQRTSVIDALHAHIALLDHDGTIVDVNKRWCDFGQKNGYAGADYGVGTNYLAICEHASGDHAGEAASTVQGIRDVLTGHVDNFVLEYPCHSRQEQRWFRVMVTPIEAQPDSKRGAVVMHIDITEYKRAEEEIQYLAFYDPLTGLPNRQLLQDRLRQAMATGSRNDRHGGLLLIDLDNFKAVNDTLGHDIGDLLLQKVAQRLTTCVRESDTISRLGGDEFVVMLADLSQNPIEAAAQAETVGEKLLATLNEPYQLAEHEYHSTPSIGITLFKGYENTLDELLKWIDLAMYQAKAAGRNTLRFFDPEMQAVMSARVELETDLRRALQENEFVLYYQPQINHDGSVTGAEALVRWQHPLRGLVLPDEFIPLSEDTGLILPLGRQILEAACRQLVIWASQPLTAGLNLAVNVSARQFHHPDYVDQVLTVLDQTGANPRNLMLELTESVLIEDIDDTISKMTALKAKGVWFSLDDFGTGYSSLVYLKRLPLSLLKIDQSFVRDVLADRNDATIVHAIIALSQNLGMEVIAEGVETEAQRDFLLQNGCRAYQGYLFAPALPIEQFEQYMQAHG